MLSGHLQVKKEYYYVVLNCKHPDGRRFQKWISTGIAAKRGNKRAAEETLLDFRMNYNEYGERISDGNGSPSNSAPRKKGKSSTARTPDGSVRNAPANPYGNMLFADYMLSWLSCKEIEVDPVTYAGYCESVEKHIYCPLSFSSVANTLLVFAKK